MQAAAIILDCRGLDSIVNPHVFLIPKSPQGLSADLALREKDYQGVANWLQRAEIYILRLCGHFKHW